MLVYPVVDFSEDFSKYKDDTKSPTNTGQELQWIKKHCFKKKTDVLDARASPALAKNLNNMPPTLIVTAEYDLLTRQCKTFVARLKSAGIPVRLIHRKGTIHGFFVLPNIFDASKETVDEIAKEVRRIFEP